MKKPLSGPETGKWPRARSIAAFIFLHCIPASGPAVGAEPAADSLAAASAKPVAFVDISIIPMDHEGVVPHQTVVTQGGRIVAAGPVLDAPVAPS